MPGARTLLCLAPAVVCTVLFIFIFSGLHKVGEALPKFVKMLMWHFMHLFTHVQLLITLQWQVLHHLAFVLGTMQPSTLHSMLQRAQ